jgi:hypothetical protein
VREREGRGGRITEDKATVLSFCRKKKKPVHVTIVTNIDDTAFRVVSCSGQHHGGSRRGRGSRVVHLVESIWLSQRDGDCKG